MVDEVRFESRVEDGVSAKSLFPLVVFDRFGFFVEIEH